VRALAAALCLVAISCSKPIAYRATELPPGTVELHRPISVAGLTELRGAHKGTTLHMAADFQGPAAIVVQGNDVWLHDFSIDGNRAALEVKQGLPPYDRSFANFTANNGITAVSRQAVEIDNVGLRNIAGFAILASRVARMHVRQATVEDSGSRNAAGRNNATGGILFEEGSSHFSVENCTFRNILGNALWTHSLYASPRNQRGVFARNRIDTLGRDAIQIGHATNMIVADNIASHIGFPAEAEDLENRAIPVGIDTAGNVDSTSYLRNRITEINGKCIDLDGLHDSEIRGNACVNRNSPAAYPLGNYAIVMNNTNPDMRTQNIRIVENRIERPVFGAIFVIGERNLIARNLLLDLNTAQCNQNIAHYQCNYAAADPHILEAGVYLGRGAERPAPARNNIVEYNLITGWGMKTRCVVSAPDIPASWNIVRGNDCR
jgi:Right handed beta helix region